jgi:hypothetical protein
MLGAIHGSAVFSCDGEAVRISRRTSNIAGIVRVDTGRYIAWLTDRNVAVLSGIVGSFILARGDAVTDPESGLAFTFATDYGQIIGNPSGSTSSPGSDSGSAYTGCYSKPFACLRKVFTGAVYADPSELAHLYLI